MILTALTMIALAGRNEVPERIPENPVRQEWMITVSGPEIWKPEESGNGNGK